MAGEVGKTVFEKGKSFIEQFPYRLSLAYLALGGGWILFSDKLLLGLTDDPFMLTKLQTMKGWLYVTITTIVLYILSRRFSKQVQEREYQLQASKQDLEAMYEELAATDEELRQQFDEILHTSTLLQQSEEQYRSLFDNMVSAYVLHEIICDAGGRPVDYRFSVVNPAFERLTGFSRQEVLDKMLLDIIPTINRDWVEAYGRVVLTGRPVSFVKQVRELGRYYSVDVYPAKPGYLAVQFLDVTEQQAQEQRIERLEFFDSLTGLPNRTLFIDRLTVAIARARSGGENLGVLFVDIDSFKIINDILGHALGDQFLRNMATRLKQCIGEQDSVARTAGDEFAVLLTNLAGLSAVTAIVASIQAEIKQQLSIGGHEFSTTACIGAAFYPAHGSNAEALMQRADIAMVKAKETGKETFLFYQESMDIRALDRIALSNNLHNALERREFVLHYQPQVDPAGSVVGVEALIRWNHPTKGILYPNDFIPLAEENGQIIQIGEWVIAEACKQNRVWQQAGMPSVCVSINLSARQFRQENLLEIISRALALSALDACWLRIEITESTAMHDSDYTVNTLLALKDMGIKISIDDFGTGYSSLMYLKRFPTSTLKIDRSFVHDIISNPDDIAIVKAIISLAHNLKMKVVAEGVETEEQFTCLKGLMCDEFQGYLFSRPVAAEEIPPFLQNNR